MTINTKRRNLRILFKLIVLKNLGKAQNITKTATRFGISRKSVRAWRGKKKVWKQQLTEE